jgi:hypothetical protein
MRRFTIAVALALLTVAIAAYAQSPGYGPGGYRGGPGGWGVGMMGRGYGPGYGRGQGPGYGCPGWGNPEYVPPEGGISADKAKETATEYANKYLKGFTVERVLPFTGMRHTVYGVELKGPKDEVRYLRINPWGGVMPFGGGPWTAQ